MLLSILKIVLLMATLYGCFVGWIFAKEFISHWLLIFPFIASFAGDLDLNIIEVGLWDVCIAPIGKVFAFNATNFAEDLVSINVVTSEGDDKLFPSWLWACDGIFVFGLP